MIVIIGVSGSYADIYTWTDENGVRHYSVSPPEDAKDAKTVFPEYQYDEKADKNRRETDQKQLKSLIKEIEADISNKKALISEAEKSVVALKQAIVSTENEIISVDGQLSSQEK